MPYKDKYMEYLRGVRRRQEHQDELQEYQIGWRSKNHEVLKVSTDRNRKEWDQEHPEFRAKQQLAHKIAKKIPKADFCELCPEDDKKSIKLIRHHPDYDYPTIFLTLCTKCHKELHLNPNNDKPKPY